VTFERALGRESLGRRLFSTPDLALKVLEAAWPPTVGPELARRTELVALEGGCLWVRVPDPRWRKVLHRMTGDLRHRLRRRVGDMAPARLAFVLGPVAESEQAATPQPEAIAPGPPPEAVASAAQAIADPELRRLFLESSARYLRRHGTRRTPDA
jgi:predicted nucleic acid-binding Zn ribbon protein